MVATPTSKYPDAGTLAGTDLVAVSKPSSTVTITAATISAQASDNSINDSANGFIAAGFAVDDYVNTAGFTGNTANNIFSVKITALTAGKMTFGGTDGDVIVDDAAGESVTVKKWTSRRTAISNIPGPFMGAQVKKAADQTAANYSTDAVVTWDAEVYDTDSIHSKASTVTITIASPGVVSWAGHGLVAGVPIVFTTTGALPTGLVAGTTYYIVSPTADAFSVAATVGGAAINTSGTQSGVHTATTANTALIVPAGVSYIRIGFYLYLSSVATSSAARAHIRKNGVEILAVASSFQTSAQVPGVTGSSGPLAVVPGDSFEVWLNCSDTSISVVSNVSNFWLEVVEAAHVSQTGRLIGVQRMTATGAGTYIPTVGTSSIIIELQGGGGGGGAVVSPTGTNGAAGAGGGGGAFLRKRLLTAFSGAAYVVGAKGAGGAAGANNGVAGADTTFTATGGGGIVCTAAGGGGGGTGTSVVIPLRSGAAFGGSATNGDDNITGGQSGRGLIVGTACGIGAPGGPSVLGMFVVGTSVAAVNTSAAGAAATGKGGGGGGGVAVGTGAAVAGGDGSDGIIIIWEYA